MKFNELAYTCRCGQRNNIYDAISNGWLDTDVVMSNILSCPTKPDLVFDCDCQECGVPFRIEYSPTGKELRAYDDFGVMMKVASWFEDME